jgi:prepilin-type N-terminal cleavage/methylation domain-containing protein
MFTKTAVANEVAAAGRRQARRRGFTLVEILTVVVILGIASAIIIPQMGTRDDMRAKAAARTLVADLIYAQNLAISTGQVVYVRFDVAANSYSLLTNPANAKAKKGDPVEHPLRGEGEDYVTQFGPTSRGYEQVKIESAVMNGVDLPFQPEFTVGFDEIGSPHVWCYDTDQRNELASGTVIVKAGQFTNKITISAATGEILVD